MAGVSFLIFLATFYAVFFGVAFIQVIISMVYAKNNGIKNWGLLLLPFGAEYIMGQLADQYEDKNAKKKYPMFMLLVAGAFFVFMILFIVATISDPDMESAMSILCVIIGYLLVIASAIIYSVYGYFVRYRIIAYKNRESAAIWLVLIIMFSIPFAIFQLVYLNKKGYSKDSMALVSTAELSEPTEVETTVSDEIIEIQEPTEE